VNLARAAVRNPVAVNLLMWVVVGTGLYFWFTLVREFFPYVEPERITISVAFPGATPVEVERLVTRPIEREVSDIDGVDEVKARVLEGVTLLDLELEDGADRSRALDDVRTRVDRVKVDLPDGAEEPVVTEQRARLPVIGAVIYGQVNEDRLHAAAIDLRDELQALPDITDVVVSGIRNRELLIQIRPEALEEHGLTFAQVGDVIARSNLDVPGGQLKGGGGNVRVRTLGETSEAVSLEELVVRAEADGSAVRLRDVATVREGFADEVDRGRWGGEPAVLVTVFKTPEQDALEISSRVKRFVAENPTRLGGALRVETTTDLSRFIEQRLDLMKRNARFGLVLVIIALALLLDVRTAFWVAAGLPIAFLGTFTAMHLLGASINLISMFGLIVVLGLIVDDAIVIGENVFAKIRAGVPPAQAAVEGTTEVSLPVLAAVLTTILAFVPLMFIEGKIGAFLGVLPLVVIAALGVSLIEAFIILPMHLAHARERGVLKRWAPRVHAWGQRFHARKLRLFEVTLPGALERVLRLALHWRYATAALAVALSLGVAGLVAGGVIPFVLIQESDAETISVELEMAAGTPEERTVEVLAEIERMIMSYPETKSTFAVVGSTFNDRGEVVPPDPATVGQIVWDLQSAEERELEGLRDSKQILADIRARCTAVPGVNQLSFRARQGGPEGADIEVRVRAPDVSTLESAVAHVRGLIAGYGGVDQITDDLGRGKLELRLRLKDSARALGLTTGALAQQLRSAVYGLEAQELQVGNERVKVRVQLPASARREPADLGRLRIATPAGGRVPLDEVAEISTERGYASLARVDGRRAATIQAEVEEELANASDITTDLGGRLADLGERFPGATYTFEGQRRQAAESVGSLMYLFPAALLLVYGIMAVLFRSYTQPLVVMSAIPYALVGAVLGHWFAGYPFTILSMIGGVALTGIVVNDSLILVDFINRARRLGLGTIEAAVQGSRRRLRAILLTTITTVAGLAPLMLERSFQAQFLIPMAVSIVYGIVFATALTLILIPVLYTLLDDARTVARWLVTGTWTRAIHRDPARVELDAAPAA
jgi:multidrug efflux pump subunit AcrB